MTENAKVTHAKMFAVLTAVSVLLFIPIARSVTISGYSYSCVGSYSYEIVRDHLDIVQNNNSILCQNGCSTQQPIRCYEGRTPQCDFCVVNDLNTSNYLIWAVIVVGNVAFIVFMFFLYNNIPPVFISIVQICFMIFSILLLLTIRLPDWLNGTQQIVVSWIAIIDLIIIGFYSLYRIVWRD